MSFFETANEMLICWPARKQVWGTQGHKSTFFLSERRERGLLVVFMSDKKIWASFQAPSDSRSFTERGRREFRAEERNLSRLAGTSEATYRLPSCCLKVVQVRPVFKHPTEPMSLLWTHWVIPGAPGRLSHFFFFFFFSGYHTDSDICTRSRCSTFLATCLTT